MTDEEAHERFKTLRWADNGGEPYCPRCGCGAPYSYRTRRIWKCKECRYQFSVTSGTIFASRKLPIRRYLFAIAIFVNGVKGHSALRLGRDLVVQYKTAFVLLHKLREAVSADYIGRTARGEVEIDGAAFGGYLKPANWKKNRRDRRLARNQNGKRRWVVIIRERNGRTLSFVFDREDASIPTIYRHLTEGTVVYADEASHWDVLHARYETHRINHSQAYSDGMACTNMAESFFSRLRRAEIGTHHHIAGPYLAAYAGEMTWREDNRRTSNGDLWSLAAQAALHHPVSQRWCGYWQRHLR